MQKKIPMKIKIPYFLRFCNIPKEITLMKIKSLH